MFDIAHDPLPYECVTGRDLFIQWSFTALGVPEDLSDVTAAEVVVQLQVARGEDAPASITWSMDDDFIVVEDDQITLTVDKAVTDTMVVGLYSLQLNLARTDLDETPLIGTLSVEQGL